MNLREYVFSLVMAALLLTGAAAWTHDETPVNGKGAAACRAGQTPSPVVLKGFSVYRPCPGEKRG